MSFHRPKLYLISLLVLIGKAGSLSAEYPKGIHNLRLTANVQEEPGFSPFSQSFQSLGGPDLTSATAITPEIEELARGLMHDENLIFEFVRNHIEYTHYYGCKKGAALTLLEGSGNDFDQSALLVALLRASGHTAVFRLGRMEIPVSSATSPDLVRWLGISDVAALADYVVRGGTPQDQSEFYFDAFVLPRVWVQLSVGENDYQLDPSFKQYEEIPGLGNLGVIMEYERSALLSSAGGEVSENPAFVKDLDFENIFANLKTYTENLVDYISENANGASVSEIVSGRRIVEETFEELPEELPFTIVEGLDPWQEIPSGYGMLLELEIGGIQESVFTADLKGQRFSLVFLDNKAQLWLDDTLLFEETGSPGPGEVSLICKIVNPSPETALSLPPNTYVCQRDGQYALLYAFTPSGKLLEFRQKKLEAYRRDPEPSGTSRDIITEETLNVMGASWMWQTYLVDELIDRLLGVKTIRHHRFGRMGQEASFYIDVGTQLISSTSKTSDTTAESGSFAASTFFQSALEHSVIEQLQGSTYEAASTIKLLCEANRLKHRIFRADSSNWNLIQNELSHHNVGQLSADINAGFTLLLPENGAIAIKNWSGAGYIAAVDNFIAMLISPTLKGGFAGEEGTVDSGITQNEASSSPAYTSPTPPTQTPPASAEPVDLSSGAYFLDARDLEVGDSGTRGLSFVRNYNSNRRFSDATGLGPGWVHNCDIRVTQRSAPEAALGLATPHEAASFIVSAFVAADVYMNGSTAKDWMTAALVTHWGIESIYKNAAVVSIGPKSLQFIRRPDGSFQSPPGVKATLSLVNEKYILTEPFGNTYRFNADDRIQEIEDFFGEKKLFGYENGRLKTVTDAHERTLIFGYTGDRLTSVTDSTGREVSYGHDGDGNLNS